jgi:hypothetical protein
MRRVGFSGLIAVTMALAVPVEAAQFVVTFPSATPVPGNNDFQSDLAGIGLGYYASSGATLALTGKGKVAFHYLGSESGFKDTFAAGPVSGSENNADNWAAPVLLGSAIFNGGAITDWQFGSDRGLSAVVGDDGFGIFLPGLRGLTASPYSSSVVYFGFDDQVTNIDDNHDDFIIRATVTGVPEPTTWALLIAGFGLVGMAVRRSGSRAATA